MEQDNHKNMTFNLSQIQAPRLEVKTKYKRINSKWEMLSKLFKQADLRSTKMQTVLPGKAVKQMNVLLSTCLEGLSHKIMDMFCRQTSLQTVLRE